MFLPNRHVFFESKRIQGRVQYPCITYCFWTRPTVPNRQKIDGKVTFEYSYLFLIFSINNNLTFNDELLLLILLIQL